MGGESIERRRVKGREVGREGGRHSKAALSGTDDDDGMADETALSLWMLVRWDGRHAVSLFLREG